MKKKILTNLVIIGGGPSGIWGAYYAALRGLSIHLIEKSNQLGGMPFHIFPTKRILDFPGLANINGLDLINLLKKQLSKQSKMINVHLSCFPTSIQKKNGKIIIHLSNDTLIETKCLLFAHGGGSFIPRKLNDVAMDSNVPINYYVKNIKDFKNKNIFISGGGNSALDYALIFAELNPQKNIYLAHRRNEFRGNKSKVVRLNKKQNIIMLKPCKILTIKQSLNEIHIQILHNDKKKEIICDEVLIQHGFNFEKNSIQIKDLEIDKSSLPFKYITNNKFETNLSQIYITSQLSSFFAENLIHISLANVSIAICDIANKYFDKRSVFT